MLNFHLAILAVRAYALNGGNKCHITNVIAGFFSVESQQLSYLLQQPRLGLSAHEVGVFLQ